MHRSSTPQTIRNLPRITSAACLLAALLLGVTARHAFSQEDSQSDEEIAWENLAVQADIDGRPEGMLANKAPRFFLFRDKRGWNVVIANNSNRRNRAKFYGTIRVDQGEIEFAVPIGKDRQREDAIQLQGDTLRFQMLTFKKADGFYFDVSEDARFIYFDLHTPAKKRHARRVFLGSEGAHPKRIPFVIPNRPREKPSREKPSSD